MKTGFLGEAFTLTRYLGLTLFGNGPIASKHFPLYKFSVSPLPHYQKRVRVCRSVAVDQFGALPAEPYTINYVGSFLRREIRIVSGPTEGGRQIASLMNRALDILQKYRQRLGFPMLLWGKREVQDCETLLALLRAGLQSSE